LSADKKKLYDTSYGVEVSGVSPSGLFAKAGISRGFVVLKIGERRISTPAEAESAIEAVSSSNDKDKALFLTVIQPNGKVRFITVELSAEE
ncbi:MAG: deoxyribonuclease HsdR, partial [Dysgonomonas sp.]